MQSRVRMRVKMHACMCVSTFEQSLASVLMGFACTCMHGCVTVYVCARACARVCERWHTAYVDVSLM